MQRLTGGLKNYAWGSTTLFSELRGVAAASKPEAELWFGAHPGAPTSFDDGSSLLDQVGQDPVGLLGGAIVDKFGPRLPFLLKLLAAASPLSIQAHPSKEQARAGFAREEAAGIPRDGFDRSFPDDNHKPELIVALTPFEALVGFRPVQQTMSFFEAVGWHSMLRRLPSEGPKDIVEGLLRPETWDLSAADIDGFVSELVAGCETYQGAQWGHVASLIVRLASAYPGDPGVGVAGLLNHIILEPGQGLYLEAGQLHSYVGGLAVELMASSDNVLRAGLTPKHIDVENLLEGLEPDVYHPKTLGADGDGQYETAASEFELHHLDASSSHEVTGPSIVLCTHGTAQLANDSGQLELLPTQACWLEAEETATVSGTDFSLWLASVGSIDRLPVG